MKKGSYLIRAFQKIPLRNDEEGHSGRRKRPFLMDAFEKPNLKKINYSFEKELITFRCLKKFSLKSDKEVFLF